AGVRLGVALAPDRLAARDAGQETLFLLLAAERDQGGREQPLADVAEPARPAGARVLLVPDHLLDQRRAAPARLARPAEPDPARLAEPPLPRAALLDHRVLVARAAAPAQRRERAGQVGGEPRLHLAAKRLVLVREAQLHADSRRHRRRRSGRPAGARCGAEGWRRRYYDT